MTKWVLTIYEEEKLTRINGPDCTATTDWHPLQAHGHVEVVDPQAGAIVINEINDERGFPAHYRLDEYTATWQCPSCGATRTEGTA